MTDTNAVDDKLLATREGTDASLEAERAATDVAVELTARVAQVAADAQLAEARAATDGELNELRARADRTAVARGALTPFARSGILHERTDTDAILAEEREQADAALAVEREAATPVVVVDQLRDVTDTNLTDEREHVDTALSNAEEQLARRQEILAMVTHDLRQPLMIMELCIERLARDATTPDAVSIANDARDAAGQMRRLVADLLDIASLDSGTFRVVRRSCDVLALLGEVHAAHAPLFREHGQRFALEVTAERLVAAIDRDRMMQVLGNLLGNAMHFAPRGGLVTLGAAARDKDIIVTVRNSGPTIPASVRSKLFERFSPGDRGERRGLGLGLYIAKCIVEAQGGTLAFDPEVADGALFWLTLPREQGAP
jgi:signal transduction histidine kinase